MEQEKKKLELTKLYNAVSKEADSMSKVADPIAKLGAMQSYLEGRSRLPPPNALQEGRYTYGTTRPA